MTAWSLPEVRAAIGAIGFFALGGAAQLSDGPSWLYWALYLVCYLVGGWIPGREGLAALRNGALDVDLLMVAAAIGAASIGQIFDGALLIVIFAGSGALEALATMRTENSVRALLDLAPPTATRLARGQEERVATAELGAGDVLLIRPGERIGGDGVVIDGVSTVDQSSITGESVPVDKCPGDEVFAGALNGSGSLTVRVDRPAADSVIARIAALVAEASASKANLQLFVEKVERRYSVGMVAATLALFAIPLMFGADLQSALLRAMTFMIVASPCALVLSTMPPMLAVIANAGRRGVLIKSAVVLERLAEVDRVAFDKTGTLTAGEPVLVSVCGLSGMTDDQLLGLAAAAERGSEHPLAAAIVSTARMRGLVDVNPAVGQFLSTPGRGVAVRVGAERVSVGSTALLGPDDVVAADLAVELERAGQTVVVVLVDGVAVGVLGLADRPRAEAAAVIAELETLTGASPVLLTGDNHSAATRLASDVGISSVSAALLPEQKLAEVRRMQDDGDRVLLVGDGVNDAPAMAAAHVGVAMGRRGSDLALETADVILVRDDLAALPGVVELARRARRVVIANLAIAATFIVVLVAWDLFGHLPLPLGVAGHEGSTILVGLNGLRLLRASGRGRAVGPR